MNKSLIVRWLGKRPYVPTLALQEKIQQRVINSCTPGREPVGELLLVEHSDSVITVGRRDSTGDILYSDDELRRLDVTVVKTRRGGLATYHGPGMLMVYPIVHIPTLRNSLSDDAAGARNGAHLVWYSGFLERLTASVVNSPTLPFSPAGCTVGTADSVGVWLQAPTGAHPGKIAAVGVQVSRWVTTHGVALNVCADHHRFNAVVPCGLGVSGAVSTLAEVAAAIAPQVSVCDAASTPPDLTASSAARFDGDLGKDGATRRGGSVATASGDVYRDPSAVVEVVPTVPFTGRHGTLSGWRDEGLGGEKLSPPSLREVVQASGRGAEIVRTLFRPEHFVRSYVDALCMAGIDVVFRDDSVVKDPE